jgi:hypothetical protein
LVEHGVQVIDFNRIIVVETNRVNSRRFHQCRIVYLQNMPIMHYILMRLYRILKEKKGGTRYEILKCRLYKCRLYKYP